MKLKKRKQMRSEYIDYSSAGAYFVTVCTKDKQNIFWDMERINPLSIAEGFRQSVGAIANRPYGFEGYKTTEISRHKANRIFSFATFIF